MMEEETVEMVAYRRYRWWHRFVTNGGGRNGRDGGIQTLKMVAYRR
jgi:hypothetical protein